MSDDVYGLDAESILRLRQLLTDYESGRLFPFPRFRGRGLGPPIEVAVGVAYDTIGAVNAVTDAGTDNLYGHSGLVTIWRVDTTTGKWTATDQRVTAYDWAQHGISSGDPVALIRSSSEKEIRWVAIKSASGTSSTPPFAKSLWTASSDFIGDTGLSSWDYNGDATVFGTDAGVLCVLKDGTYLRVFEVMAQATFSAVSILAPTLPAPPTVTLTVPADQTSVQDAINTIYTNVQTALTSLTALIPTGAELHISCNTPGDSTQFAEDGYAAVIANLTPGNPDPANANLSSSSPNVSAIAFSVDALDAGDHINPTARLQGTSGLQALGAFTVVYLGP